MKTLYFLVTSVVLTAGITRPCLAEPHQARFSLMGFPPLGVAAATTGAELETKLGITPLTFGGQVAYITDGSHAQGTVWLRYGHTFSSGIKVGGLVGLTHTWDRRPTPAMAGALPDPSLYPSYLGYVIGVSARKEWGSFWGQTNPNYLIIPGFTTSMAPWQVLGSGIPWLELGYKITPAFDMSLRYSLTPLSASFRF